MRTGSDRYSLQADGSEIALWDNYRSEPVFVVAAKNRLNRGERIAEAAESVLAKLDYLQGLWGKEGITNTLAEQLRLALAGDTEEAAK